MHTMHRRIVTDTGTGMYITYASVGFNVGVGVDVAMGVMVGVANVEVRESVVATKRKQRNMVKMHFNWFACVHLNLCPQFTDLAGIITPFCLDLYRHSMKFVLLSVSVCRKLLEIHLAVILYIVLMR